MWAEIILVWFAFSFACIVLMRVGQTFLFVQTKYLLLAGGLLGAFWTAVFFGLYALVRSA